MSAIDWLRGVFAGRKGDPGEAIARLIRAAQQDAAFRERLLFLLRAPELQRQSLINTALHEMELRGEPADLRAAFAVLATPGGASTALRALGE